MSCYFVKCKILKQLIRYNVDSQTHLGHVAGNSSTPNSSRVLRLWENNVSERKDLYVKWILTVVKIGRPIVSIRPLLASAECAHLDLAILFNQMQIFLSPNEYSRDWRYSAVLIETMGRYIFLVTVFIRRKNKNKSQQMGNNNKHIIGLLLTENCDFPHSPNYRLRNTTYFNRVMYLVRRKCRDPDTVVQHGSAHNPVWALTTQPTSYVKPWKRVLFSNNSWYCLLSLIIKSHEVNTEHQPTSGPDPYNTV